MADRSSEFSGHHFIAFIEDVAPLRMAQNDEFAAKFFYHQGANFSGERTTALPMTILRSQLDFTREGCFTH
jgi:hypothetical protein